MIENPMMSYGFGGGIGLLPTVCVCFMLCLMLSVNMKFYELVLPAVVWLIFAFLISGILLIAEKFKIRYKM